MAAVCVALDGLPLAIELAAARTRSLEPEAMLGRLESRLELLTAGPRDVPARQRTLRATLDWSFELLDDDEQALLARLSVFSGSCTLAAAEVVCGADVDALSSLADKSLLRREEMPEGEPRFSLLETVREYALERLEERGEAEQAHRSHAEHIRGLAEGAAAQLRAGEPSSEVYARLESELDNIRAALRWADAAAPESMLQIAGLLKLFWRVRGHLDEGRRWLEIALAHGDPEATPGRARALEAAGALAQRRGDYASAKTLWQEGLEGWRALGDDQGVARCLGDLGSVYDLEGDSERAISLYEESADLLRRLGLDYELGPVVSNLGVCLMSQGRLDEGAQLYEEAVELCRSSGREEQLVISLFNLGRVSTLQGRQEAAGDLFEQALAAARDLGYREMIAYSLKGIGEVRAEAGEPEVAAQLLGAADRLFAELGAHVEATEQATYERTVEHLKGVLGDEAYAAAHAQGQALSPEQTLGLAFGRIPA